MTALVQEANGGPCWLVDGPRGHLCWSPTWRSEVLDHQRISHVGVVGKATCIGWRLDAGVAPFLPGARALAQLELDQRSRQHVEQALLAAGVPVRPAGTPAPPAVPA